MKAIDFETESVHEVVSIDFENQIVHLESSEYGRTRQDVEKVILIREEYDPKILSLNKEQKVETSTEPDIVGNTVLAVRCYQIDFGIHLRCKIKVTDNGIEVEGAMNGWGDRVPLDEVVVVEVQ